MIGTLGCNRTPVLKRDYTPWPSGTPPAANAGFPESARALSNRRRPTRTQERRRIDGLRILARIIARHYLAHPELYPAPVAEGAAPPVDSHGDGHGAGDGKAAAGDGDHGP